MSDEGFVIQTKEKPGDEWETQWSTASHDEDYAIQEYEGEADWDVAVKWGMARLMRCVVKEHGDE